MQIIIVEAEIKQAITELIMSQMSIKENMDINIDLSATRGIDGFKATIDIVPKKNAAPVSTPKENGPGPSAASKGNPALSQGKEQTPPPVDKEPEPAAGSGQTSTQTAGETGNDSPGSASEAGATDAAPGDAEPQQGEGEEVPAKPAGRSLFTNLKRVNNA